MLKTHNKSELPAHVSPDLVRPYPYVWQAKTEGDPYAPIATIHREWPSLFYAPGAAIGGVPSWIVRRMEDCRKLYLDTEDFSNAPQGGFGKLIGENWGNLPSESDPPAHRFYRALLVPVFTPAVMVKLEDRIRLCVRDYVASFRHKGHCEILSEFAFGFPIKIFLELMGLSMERAPDLLRWASGVIRGSDIEIVKQSTRFLANYLRGLIAERRRNPGDDMITYIVQGKVDMRALNEDEILGVVFNVFIGGLDTVSSSISLHLWHLAQHLDHQRYLRANPDKIPMAVEELMRAYAVTISMRKCVKDTEFNGVVIKAGDYLGLQTWLPARDPEEFANPEKVILDRNPKHVSFGSGPHMCIGIHLARRELRIALEEFLTTLPEFQIAPDAKITWSLFGVIQPDHLPLVWHA